MSHVSSFVNSKLLAIRTFGGFETNCVLKYAQDTIRFYLTSSTFKWELTMIKVKFKDIEIGQRNLVIEEPTKRFDIDDQATITINIKNIFLDLFATTDDRTFVVVVNFKNEAKHQCTSTFMFSLPIIPKQR